MSRPRPRLTPADIVEALVANEGREVTLHFEDWPSVPSEPYDNRSYSHETIREKSITATVETAEIEDGGITLISFATVGHDEKMRLGLNPEAVGERVVELEIHSDDHDGDGWGRPIVHITPEVSEAGARQHVESGYSLATSPPRHEVGELRGVEGPNETESGPHRMTSSGPPGRP